MPGLFAVLAASDRDILRERCLLSGLELGPLPATSTVSWSYFTGISLSGTQLPDSWWRGGHDEPLPETLPSSHDYDTCQIRGSRPQRRLGRPRNGHGRRHPVGHILARARLAARHSVFAEERLTARSGNDHLNCQVVIRFFGSIRWRI